MRLNSPDGTRLRRWCEHEAGLTLGIGLGMAEPGTPEADAFFRLAHMGHVNAHMVLGALSVMQAGMEALGIEHGRARWRRRRGRWPATRHPPCGCGPAGRRCANASAQRATRRPRRVEKSRRNPLFRGVIRFYMRHPDPQTPGGRPARRARQGWHGEHGHGHHADHLGGSRRLPAAMAPRDPVLFLSPAALQAQARRFLTAFRAS
jgi:hypothetical protein